VGRFPVHTFSHEGKPVLVKTKEHIMSTTIDTNVEGGILTIDQAAAYLSIPRRRCTPGGPGELASGLEP